MLSVSKPLTHLDKQSALGCRGVRLHAVGPPAESVSLAVFEGLLLFADGRPSSSPVARYLCHGWRDGHLTVFSVKSKEAFEVLARLIERAIEHHADDHSATERLRRAKEPVERGALLARCQPPGGHN